MLFLRWNWVVMVGLGLGLGAHGSGRVEPKVTPFGTTEELRGALHGRVYRLPTGTKVLPDFEKLTAVSDVFTESLDVKPREYTESLWSVIPAMEWFGIDYTGRFWIAKAGEYKFFLQSDDGSRLTIDDVVAIDDDGVHPPSAIKGAVVRLTEGMHRMRVSYFQGPGPGIALVLAVQAPEGKAEVFDMRKFRSPEREATPLLAGREGGDENEALAGTGGKQTAGRRRAQVQANLEPKWALAASLDVLTGGVQVQSVEMRGSANKGGGMTPFALKAHRFSRSDGSSVERASPDWLMSEVRDGLPGKDDPALVAGAAGKGIDAGLGRAAETDWFFPAFLLDRMVMDPATAVLRTSQNGEVVEVVAHRRVPGSADTGIYLSGKEVLREVSLDFDLETLELMKYSYCADVMTSPCRRVVVRYMEYRTIDGVGVPMHVEKSVAGQLVVDLRVDGVVVGKTAGQ